MRQHRCPCWRKGPPVPTYPSVDESRDRLHRAGWSLGETRMGSTWQVDGSNGENRLLVTDTRPQEALLAALVHDLHIQGFWHQMGSLQLFASENSAGTRSLPQILRPARLGCSLKEAFLSRKYLSMAVFPSSMD